MKKAQPDFVSTKSITNNDGINQMSMENSISLLAHAIRSISECVSITDMNDQIIVNITDNGQGIPPDVAQNLFTKFVSGSDSGTGLGLYISKSIIDAHRGEIWYDNNIGKGAVFSFSLPIVSIK